MESKLIGKRIIARIDVEGGKMTVREFVSLTEHSYGGKAVSSLRELYR